MVLIYFRRSVVMRWQCPQLPKVIKHKTKKNFSTTGTLIDTGKQGSRPEPPAGSDCAM